MKVGEKCSRQKKPLKAFLVKVIEWTLIWRERVQGIEEIVGGSAWEGLMVRAGV